MQYGPIDKCQSCVGQELQSVLFLGYVPPVNRMRSLESALDEEPWYPAEMLYCPNCHLAQLGYAVNPRILFPPEYPYTSGTTRILRENFAHLYREVTEQIGLSAEDLVVDIGSNDGTLLSNFLDGGQRVAGIEPTLTAELAREKGIPTVMAYLDDNSVSKVLRSHGQPTVVTATNVFAHIHDVHSIVECVGKLVGERGVFVSESHYLGDLVRSLQYDTIYHEHLRYYSVTSLAYLLEKHGLRVFRVTRIPTHGGSIRVFASRSTAFPLHESVNERLLEEERSGLRSGDWIPKFRGQVSQSKLALYELIAEIKRQGQRIYGIGAPSRASSLVTYTGLDDALVECVLEVPGSKKLNKYMPGTKIPVLDEGRLYEDPPDYALLLSWHIADELCVNLKRRGFKGSFIVPLPEPKVIHCAEVQTA